MAEPDWSEETKTFEMAGPAGALYSNAPRSVLPPWGRLTPSKSVGTTLRFMPPSTPAPPACTWKSYADGFTNIGFAPTWLLASEQPDVFAITPLAPYTMLRSTEQELTEDA
jgi:hypothetical protein